MATAVFSPMAPGAQDTIQVLLVKACYFAQYAVESGGGPTTSGMFDNMTPFASDTIQVLTAKLTYWLSQLVAGGSGGATTNIALAGATPASDGSITTKWVFDTVDSYLWYNSGTLAAPVWNNV